MQASYSVGAWHWCKNLEARAVFINDDGSPNDADHLKIFVQDTDGTRHDALVVYLPIALARDFAKAINDISAAQIALNVPVAEPMTEVTI